MKPTPRQGRPCAVADDDSWELEIFARTKVEVIKRCPPDQRKDSMYRKYRSTFQVFLNVFGGIFVNVCSVHRCSFPKCEQGSASSVNFLYDSPPLTLINWWWFLLDYGRQWHCTPTGIFCILISNNRKNTKAVPQKISLKLLFQFQTLSSLSLSTADSENQYKQYFWFMPNSISDGHKSDCNTRVTCNCILSAFVIQEIEKIW